MGAGSGASLYRRPARDAEEWRGRVERLAWGGMGVGRAEDGRLILVAAPLALFPGEEVTASVRWKARHGEGRVVAWTRPGSPPGPGRLPGCRRVRRLRPVGGRAPGPGSSSAKWSPTCWPASCPGRPPGAGWRPRRAPAGTASRCTGTAGSWASTAGTATRWCRCRPARAADRPCPGPCPGWRRPWRPGSCPRRPQRWELATGTPPGDVLRRGRVRADLAAGAGRLARRAPDPVVPPPGRGGAPAPGRRVLPGVPAWAWEAFGAILAEWGLGGDRPVRPVWGSGVLLRPAGPRFRRRVLVESDEPAVGGRGPTWRPWAWRPSAWLPTWRPGCRRDWAGRRDLVLLDPPRAGLAPELCERLLTARAGGMVLVGCDGAAFCRDLRRLAPAWKVEGLAAADLFPLTHHVECVALLRRG